MEKRRPHYNLADIKREFSSEKTLRTTTVAQRTARALGFSRAAIVEVVQTIRAAHFYKSMTSYENARQWQDVYHVPARGLVLYVKFTVDAEGKLLLSFKEK